MSIKSRTAKLVTTMALVSSLASCNALQSPTESDIANRNQVISNSLSKRDQVISDPFSANCADLREVIRLDMILADGYRHKIFGDETVKIIDAVVLSQEAANLLRIYEIKRCETSSKDKHDVKATDRD